MAQEGTSIPNPSTQGTSMSGASHRTVDLAGGYSILPHPCFRIYPRDPDRKFHEGSNQETTMATCKDCFFYTPITSQEGECRINGRIEADREQERCPSRTFRPR